MGLTRTQREAVARYLSGPGCIRFPNDDRRDEGHDVYKKGWEVRFAVRSRPEAAEVNRILVRAGLSPGRPYRKSPTRWILPVYGRDPVHRFLAWVEEVEQAV